MGNYTVVQKLFPIHKIPWELSLVGMKLTGCDTHRSRWDDLPRLGRTESSDNKVFQPQ